MTAAYTNEQRERNPILDALLWRVDDYNYCPQSGCEREIDRLHTSVTADGIVTVSTTCFDGHDHTVQVHDP